MNYRMHAALAFILFGVGLANAQSFSQYLYTGPDTKTGGISGTVTWVLTDLGNGKWKQDGYSIWNDGSRTDHPARNLRESWAEWKNVVVVPLDVSDPVSLNLTDGAMYMYRPWPGDPYPRPTNPNEFRWWKFLGQGNWTRWATFRLPSETAYYSEPTNPNSPEGHQTAAGTLPARSTVRVLRHRISYTDPLDVMHRTYYFSQIQTQNLFGVYVLSDKLQQISF